MTRSLHGMVFRDADCAGCWLKVLLDRRPVLSASEWRTKVAEDDRAMRAEYASYVAALQAQA